MDDQATKSGSEQTIDARAALVQKVQLVSEVITKKGHSNDLGPSPVDAENKKQALAELRRQTAREELRKSNTLLKVTQAPPSNSNPPCLNSPRSVSQPQEIDSSINSPSSGKHPSLSFYKLPGKPVPIQLDFGTPDGSEHASEREKDRSRLFNCEGSNAGMTSERSCDPVSVTSGSVPLNGSGHRTGTPHCPIRSVVQDIDKDSEYKKGVADIDSMKQNPSTTIDEPSVVHSGNGEKSAHASVAHARTMSPVCGSPCSPATRRNIARRLINAFEYPTMEHSPSQNLVERSSRKPLESPVSWQNPITSEEQPLSNRPKQPVSIGKTCNDVPSMFRAAQEARCQHESKESELEKSALMLSSEETDGEYYSLEQLLTGNIKNIDIRHREQYLSPDAFWQHFKMTKEQFSELPKWKRDKAKRSLKLF
jgi:Villin headpiece domain